MKLGLISDIHGNSAALEAILSQLQPRVDRTLFLGDLCGYYSFVEECVVLLNHYGVAGVRGNHDEALLRCVSDRSAPSEVYESRYGSALRRALGTLSSASLALLESLPVSRTMTLDGLRIALYHGAPWDPLEGRVYPDFTEWHRFAEVPAEVIALGNTHYAFQHQAGERLILNPGSVGQPRDRSGAACGAVLDLKTRTVEFVRATYSPGRVIEDAQSHDPGMPYLVEVLTR